VHSTRCSTRHTEISLWASCVHWLVEMKEDGNSMTAGWASRAKGKHITGGKGLGSATSKRQAAPTLLILLLLQRLVRCLPLPLLQQLAQIVRLGPSQVMVQVQTCLQDTVARQAGNAAGLDQIKEALRRSFASAPRRLWCRSRHACRTKAGIAASSQRDCRLAAPLQ
jgi:hypothetical protein